MIESASELFRKIDRCMARYRTEADQRALANTRSRLKVLFVQRDELMNNPMGDALVVHGRKRIKALEEALASDRDMTDKERHETFGAIDTWIEVIGMYDVAQIDAQITEISGTLNRYVEKTD